MKVKECMTKNVEIANPEMTIHQAAQKMKAGDYGILPVAENDRLIGMISDRDITIRAVAEGKNPDDTTIRECMSEKVLYCFDDENVDEVSENLGDHQVRRLPVLNRQKRLVGILSLGDISHEEDAEHLKSTLSRISEPKLSNYQMRQRI